MYLVFFFKTLVGVHMHLGDMLMEANLGNGLHTFKHCGGKVKTSHKQVPLNGLNESMQTRRRTGQ